VFVALADLTQDSKLNNDSYDLVDRVDQANGDVWQEAWALNRLALTGDASFADRIDEAHKEFLKDIGDAHALQHDDKDVATQIDHVKDAAEDYYSQTVEPAAPQLRDPATHDQGVEAARAPAGSAKLKDFETTTT